MRNRKYDIRIFPCFRVEAVCVVFNPAKLATIICSLQNALPYFLPVGRVTVFIFRPYRHLFILPIYVMIRSIFCCTCKMFRFIVERNAILVRTTRTKVSVRITRTSMRKHLAVPNISFIISYQNLVKRLKRIRIKFLYLRLIPKPFKLRPITLFFTWKYTYRAFETFIRIICALLGKSLTYAISIFKFHSIWIDF